MSATQEGLLKKEVKDFLNPLAPALWFYMPVPMGFGIRGIPDVIGLYKGYFFGIETKAPGKDLSPWQEKIRDRIVVAGGFHITSSLFREIEVQFTEWMKKIDAIQRRP